MFFQAEGTEVAEVASRLYPLTSKTTKKNKTIDNAHNTHHNIIKVKQNRSDAMNEV